MAYISVNAAISKLQIINFLVSISEIDWFDFDVFDSSVYCETKDKMVTARCMDEVDEEIDPLKCVTLNYIISLKWREILCRLQ